MTRTRLALILALCFLPPPAPAQDPAPASIEFLPVGQGDSTLIRTPEGKIALVDAGPDKTIVRLLRDRGVTTIDLLALSHHHADHYGGMDDVVREFHPRVFLVSGSGHTTESYLKLLKLIRDEGIPTIFPGPTPRKIELGSVVLTVLPQPPEDAIEENNNSIGIRVQHGEAAALLTGDSEEPERRWWTEHAPDLCADISVLKLAHHGSRNGTDGAWLNLVRPKLAVAMCGRGNAFGHPHRETLDLLAAKMIALRRTDRDGSVRVVSDGHGWALAGRDQGRVSPGAAVLLGRLGW